MTALIWDDQYTGPRWTYALLIRPFSSFNLPSDTAIIAGSSKPHAKYPHGTFQTCEPIAEEHVKHFTLELLEAPNESAT